MIELEHHRIHLAAVRTRVLAKIGDYERLISGAISRYTHASAFIERVNVLSMISP
ncbi:MAG: hypothetical protein M3169_13875 [Candidatus Eremiobacteraeota bacterium]|nr:hypothetical protein [Candidatus Eremiobacteraeota bacterium]